MNTHMKQKFILTGLILAISLFLWHPLPASSFSEKGDGAETVAGNKENGVTMQAVSGKVVETVNSGGYTYARVSKDGEMTWVALPKSRIPVGSEITCQSGMVMNNFSSPSLNKSFRHIVFSSGLTSLSTEATPSEVTPALDETGDVPKSKIEEFEEWEDFFK